MQNKNFKNRLWIYSSLVFAIILDTYLFPEAVMQWKPLLVLLTLIYWNMALPDKVGIFEALLFGLIMDLLNGSVFGLHGLLFVLITYICQRFFYQFRVSPIWQQSVILFFLFFVFFILLPYFLVHFFAIAGSFLYRYRLCFSDLNGIL